MLHGWCHVKCCRFGADSVYTSQPCTRLQCHFIQSHIGRVCMCLAVTCHLHFWQNDQDLLRVTAVTRGWNGYRNKSQHRKSTLEKKILPPLLPGLEPGIFRSRIRRSNHWAVPAPQVWYQSFLLLGGLFVSPTQVWYKSGLFVSPTQVWGQSFLLFGGLFVSPTQVWCQSFLLLGGLFVSPTQVWDQRFLLLGGLFVSPTQVWDQSFLLFGWAVCLTYPGLISEVSSLGWVVCPRLFVSPTQVWGQNSFPSRGSTATSHELDLLGFEIRAFRLLG